MKFIVFLRKFEKVKHLYNYDTDKIERNGGSTDYSI